MLFLKMRSQIVLASLIVSLYVVALPSGFCQLVAVDAPEKYVAPSGAPLASFPIKIHNNSATLPVVIKDVKSSCGCVVATLPSRTILPMQDVILNVTYKRPALGGTETKRIMISTDSPDQPIFVINMKIASAKMVDLDPMVVQWKQGEPQVEKNVAVTVLEPEKLHFVDVETTNDAFSVKLFTIEKDRKYMVAIKPRATDDVSKANIRVVGLESSIHPVILAETGVDE